MQPVCSERQGIECVHTSGSLWTKSWCLLACSNSHGGRVCCTHFIDKETALGTWSQAPNPDLWTQNPVPFALSHLDLESLFLCSFREQCYPPATRWVMGLLEGFSIFSLSLSMSPDVFILPDWFPFYLFFFTVPQVRLRKLSQVGLNSQHTHIRQTLLPPTEFEKTTPVSGNRVSLLFL